MNDTARSFATSILRWVHRVRTGNRPRIRMGNRPRSSPRDGASRARLRLLSPARLLLVNVLLIGLLPMSLWAQEGGEALVSTTDPVSQAIVGVVVLALFVLLAMEAAHRVLIAMVCASFLWAVTYLTPYKLISFQAAARHIDMNVLFLTLTGGEPMLHPDFWDLLEEAKRRAFALRIFTNGALIDEKAADRFAALAPYCLEISIHGAGDESAVRLTQVPRSHSRLLRALELLSERGIRVFLKCVLTRFNENELAEIRAIGDRFGYEVYFDPHLVVSDDGDDYPLQYRASEEGVRRLYSDPRVRLGNSPFERKPGKIACGTGSGTFHIDPFGNVYPCLQWKTLPLPEEGPPGGPDDQRHVAPIHGCPCLLHPLSRPVGHQVRRSAEGGRRIPSRSPDPQEDGRRRRGGLT